MSPESAGKPRVAPAAVRGGRGFTLIELLVSLSIAAILLVVALPNLTNSAPRGRLTSQANAFLATLHLARSEAIKRNGRVVVCKSSNGTDCVADGNGSGWDQGWIVFHDSNNNGLHEAAEALIETHQPLARGFSLTGNGNVDDFISFHPSGAAMLTSGAFQSGTLTLCRATPTVFSEGRQIVLSGAGRARVAVVNNIAPDGCPP